MNIVTYKSLEDFIAAIGGNPLPTWKSHTLSSRKKNVDGWSGTDTYEEAVDLARFGWEAGLKEIASKVHFVREGEAKSNVKDVAGHSPDVARYIAGQPDCMNRRIITKSKRKPCLDIVVNCRFASSVKGVQIMNYGAALASVIDSLEHTGYSISLKIGVVFTLLDKQPHGLLINVKEYGDHIDIGRVAFLIAHPGFLRRLVFSWLETQKDFDIVGWGYGSGGECPKNMQGDIYFGNVNSFNGQCSTEEAAIKYVKSIISAQQPELLAA